MFSYKTYEMTQNSIIDQIQKYATQIFTIQTRQTQQENQNQHLSLSLSQSHSQQSIPNDEDNHQYPEQNYPSQINISRHIFGGSKNHNPFSNYNDKRNNDQNYNQSEKNYNYNNNYGDALHFNANRNHDKNTLTQRKDKSKKSRYAQNYVSPYNKCQVNSSTRSYMSKSYINPSKQSNHMKYIKKKIKQQIQPEISYRKQQKNLSKQKNKNLINISSKYKQARPIMEGYVEYMNQHIYKKTRNQMNYLMELQKKGQNRTKQEMEYSWKVFLQKQKEFKQSKKQRIREKQVQLIQQEEQYLERHKQKTEQTALKRDKIGLTVEQYIRKLKRQKQKMKERLHANQVQNFTTKGFQDKKFQSHHKDMFKSVIGAASIQQNFSTIRQDSSQNITQISDFQNKFRSTILKQEALLKRQKLKHQNPLKQTKLTQSNILTNIMNKRSNDLSIQKQKRNSKQRKSRSKSKNISQLLNPKYFKSINQLQQYSTSRSKDKNSFEERQKFLNYRIALEQRNPHLYGFDPKIMEASIQAIVMKQKYYKQNDSAPQYQRKHELSSYRNISNLFNPEKMQNKKTVREMSTDSKIKHFQQRFRKQKYQQMTQNSRVSNNGSISSSVIKKPGSFSYQNNAYQSRNSDLIKVKATQMDFLFNSSGVS